MPNVFISYRRDDTGNVARRLGRKLKQDLGLDDVFLDTEDIWGGDDWHSTLAQRLHASRAVVALIGDRWAGGPDGRRIFDNDDVVRWELRLTLRAGRELVPTMVDGARFPHELPDDIAPLKTRNWLDLNPSDSPERYQELLGDVFYKTCRDDGDVVVVTHDSAKADVHLRELAARLKVGALAGGRDAVRAYTHGFATLPLGDAAARWPDVFVLKDPNRHDPLLEARERGIRRNTKARVAVVSTTALASFVAGRATAASGSHSEQRGDLGQQHTGADDPRTVRDVASPSSSASPHDTPGRSLIEWWHGLSIAIKTGVVAGLVGAAVLLGVALTPDPIQLAGGRNGTAPEWTPPDDPVTTDAPLAAGGQPRTVPVGQFSPRVPTRVGYRYTEGGPVSERVMVAWDGDNISVTHFEADVFGRGSPQGSFRYLFGPDVSIDGGGCYLEDPAGCSQLFVRANSSNSAFFPGPVGNVPRFEGMLPPIEVDRTEVWAGLEAACGIAVDDNFGQIDLCVHEETGAVLYAHTTARCNDPERTDQTCVEFGAVEVSDPTPDDFSLPGA